ncbi:MAG: type II toxin-antitoxin system Phd/YefM family antitoxin [Candidatus Coproplasma sp.]
MSITITELKANLSKYLLLSATEDIYITRNGKIISMLTNPFKQKADVAKSLFGVLRADITLEEAREERLKKL